MTPLKCSPFVVSLRIMRVDIALRKRNVLLIPGVVGAAAAIEQQYVMCSTVVFAALLRVVMGAGSLPNYFVDKSVLSENLVKHDLDVMGSVPVAVIVEAASFLEHSRQFNAAWAHELYIGLRGFVPILE